MPVSAVTLALLMEAGLSGQALLDVVASMDADMQRGTSATSGAERTRRWREKKAAQASDVTVTSQKASRGDVTGTEIDEQPRVTSTYLEEPQENLSQKAPLTGGPKSSSLPKPKGRGTRLDASWTLPAEGRAYAAGLGVPAPVIEREAEKFRDFWIAKPGTGGVKLDWDATWRNWIRRAADDRGYAPAEPTSTGPPVVNGWQPGMPTDEELRAKYSRMDDADAKRTERGGTVLPERRGLYRPPETGDGSLPGAGDPAAGSGMARLGTILHEPFALATERDADGHIRRGAVDDGALPVARMAR